MVNSVRGGRTTHRRRRSNPLIIAAVITAIGGITAAIVTGVFNSHGGGSGAEPGVTAPRTTVAAPTTGTGSSTVPTATNRPSVYWSGPVAFSTEGLDFDSRPPATDQTTILYFGNTLQASANAQLAVWNQPGIPSASKCQTWVTTHPNQDVAFPAIDMQICIRTDQGRYGLLHIDSYSNNNSQVNATATIWGS
jgi:hypothetical protein